MRNGHLLGLAALGTAIWGCRDPTQITLQLQTDVACDQAVSTSIFVGMPGQVENAAPAATTSVCAESLGSLVLVPRSSDELRVGLRVAMAVNSHGDECVTPPYAENCIIARRSLSYIEHTSLTIPIALNSVCQGILCDENTTCVDGVCVDAAIDAESCRTTGICTPQSQGTGGSGAGGEGGAGGAGGEGGGFPAACPAPVTTPEIRLGGVTSATPRPVAVVGVPSPCHWGTAWSPGNSDVCFGRVAPDGLAVGEPVCSAHDGAVDHLALAYIGDGTFVLAAWASNASAKIWSIRNGALTSSSTIDGVSGGALASNGSQVMMVNAYTDSSIRYRIYEGAVTGLQFVEEATVPGASGAQPDVSWGPDDIAIGWLDNTAQNIDQQVNHVARFVHGDFATLSKIESATGVRSPVVVDHGPDDLVGLTYLDSGFAAELWTMTAAGISGGGNAGNDYSVDTHHVRVVGTSSGWVMGFIDGSDARLTPFLLPALTGDMLTHDVASFASTLDIEVIGLQAGVAWSDGEAARFRLFDLTPAP